MRVHAAAAICALSVLAACSDPQGPCDRPDACVFEGVHLEITADLAVTAGNDPVDGLARVEPEELTLDIVVVNRGDSTAAASSLVASAAYFGATATVPRLRPGERWRAELQLAPNEPARVLRGTDTTRVFVAVGGDTDFLEILAQTFTEPFHLLVPAAHIDVRAVHDSVIFGHDALVALRVTNASRVVALPADTIFLGLADQDLFFPAWEEGIAVPELQPGGVIENAYLVRVPPDAGWLEATLSYTTVACDGSRALPGGTYLDLLGACGWSDQLIRGVPDLARCTQATAVPGVLVPTQATCTGWRDQAYWALDVQFGHRYIMDRAVGIRERDGSSYVDGVTEWVAPFTGRVYLVVGFPGSSPALHVQEIAPARTQHPRPLVAPTSPAG